MTFFSGSSDVHINHSSFSGIAGDSITFNLTTTAADVIPTILGKRKERDGELDAVRPMHAKRRNTYFSEISRDFIPVNLTTTAADVIPTILGKRKERDGELDTVRPMHAKRRRNTYFSEISRDFIPVNLTTTAADVTPAILGKRKERDSGEPDAAGLMGHNNYFSEIAGDFITFNLTTTAADVIPTIPGKRKERDGDELDAVSPMNAKRPRRSTDGLMIVNRDEVDLLGELVSDPGATYRIHSAYHGGRVVAVKVFEGPHASEDCTENVALSTKLFHPRLPKIVGISHNSSASPFLIFHGVSEKRMQSLIAKALRTDLDKSVELSMKAVQGLAAALSYISSQKISLHGGNFDVLVGNNDEPVISIHPSSSFAPQNSESKQEGHGIGVLNELCQKLFSEANSILYRDSPKRTFTTYDLKGAHAATISHVEGTSNIFDSEAVETTSPSVEPSRLKRPPRREVWWVDLGANTRSLESIARHFQDYIDCILSPPSTLRRIKASLDVSRTWHDCPGYLREEIRLTSEVSRSAIISHVFADLGERCLICGQLVDFEKDLGNPFNSDDVGVESGVETSNLSPAEESRRAQSTSPISHSPTNGEQGTRADASGTFSAQSSSSTLANALGTAASTQGPASKEPATSSAAQSNANLDPNLDPSSFSPSKNGGISVASPSSSSKPPSANATAANAAASSSSETPTDAPAMPTSSLSNKYLSTNLLPRAGAVTTTPTGHPMLIPNPRERDGSTSKVGLGQDFSATDRVRITNHDGSYAYGLVRFAARSYDKTVCLFIDGQLNRIVNHPNFIVRGYFQDGQEYTW